ncbi:MAG: hypothetical protein GOV00_01410 [Candidatus Altiarchaeota archaeon]|nr:hypothetical protein [Candidatus Altiarchaeota archaeon]
MRGTELVVSPEEETESSTYIADIYNDTHIFKKLLKHRSGEGISFALEFLRDLKKSMQRVEGKITEVDGEFTITDIGIIDEVILNGDIIDHLSDQDAFKTYEYIESRNSSESAAVEFSELQRKQHGLIQKKHAKQYNSLIEDINSLYLEDENKMTLIDKDSYNIDIAADVFEKITQEIRRGMDEGYLKYLLGNHDNEDELKKILKLSDDFKFDEEYAVRNLHFEHGHRYDGGRRRRNEEWAKEIVYRETDGKVDRIKKQVLLGAFKLIDIFMGVVEDVSNSKGPVSRALVDPLVKKYYTRFFDEETMPEATRIDEDMYRIRAHLHRHLHNREKKLIVSGPTYREGTALVISEKINGELRVPIYVCKSSPQTYMEDLPLSERANAALNDYSQKFGYSHPISTSIEVQDGPSQKVPVASHQEL